MKIESSVVSVKTVAIKPNKNMIMAPKSKLILIMVALSLRKKKICALALLVMLDKVENEDTGRRSSVRKIFQERKKYGLYHILTDELRLFDKKTFTMKC